MILLPFVGDPRECNFASHFLSLFFLLPRFVAWPLELGLGIHNPRFVAWPLELGLGTHNPRFVVWPLELGLGTHNPRFVVWPLELGLGIHNPRFVAWPLELGLGTHNPRFVAWPLELGLGSHNPRFVAWPLELGLGTHMVYAPPLLVAQIYKVRNEHWVLRLLLVSPTRTFLCLVFNPLCNKPYIVGVNTEELAIVNLIAEQEGIEPRP